MAAFDTSRPAAGLSAGSFSRFVADAFGALATWSDARQTRKALSALTDRELDDIGLCRGDIENI